MAEKTINALQVFDNGTELNYIEKDGEILFTAEEVGRHLGYSDPAKAIGNLFNRNYNELKLYTSILKLREFNNSTQISSPNGVRVFTEEGVYILSMLARTNEAKKFRARVALLLRRLRQEAIKRATEHTRLITASRALALTPQTKTNMLKALRYRERGFTYREICKVMGLHQRAVGYLLKTARELGLGVNHETA